MMSVLMEFAMFPTDKGGSVSEYVSKIVDMVREDNLQYKLTAMGTIVETEDVKSALQIIQKAHDVLTPDSERIYVSINMDIQKNKKDRLSGKIRSIEDKIGEVNL